ncbi:MAG TPA: Imm61 family immunity protein [Mycobacterium sp.]
MRNLDRVGVHRAPITLGADCIGWARTAHYVTAVADDGDMQLRSEVGGLTRYFIRRRGPDRVELTQADDGDYERPLLFVANTEVLERYLVGLFADDIREDLDLDFLQLRWGRADLAHGFELTDMVRGYRTLKRAGGEPVAAAPDPILSLLALVPLSHYLQWAIPDLKRSFLSASGMPLLRNGQYSTR